MPDFPRAMVLKATGGRLVGGSAPEAFRGVSTDSRSGPRGALFVALKGEQFDGHDFVPEAFAGGAGAALVSRELPAAGPLIVVRDTLEALGALAAANRNLLSPRVVAITGSTGKTTTKEMIAAILSRGWKTARTPGNYNNEIGVPLALLELEASHEAAVVELAMRGKGQIDYLARMARPQVGVITNIGVSHLELLGSRQAIAEAKSELLDTLPDEGAAVLNADDEFFSFLKERASCRTISFGRSDEAEVQADEVAVGSDGSTELLLRGWWGDHRISLRTAGRHHALNAAAAAAAAMAAGAEAEWVGAGLEAFEGAEMRSRIVKAQGGFTIIDDCYNAAPDSMRVALELLADLPGNRKWAVLGDMKELGPMSADWHREVGELAARLGVAGVVTVGDLARDIAAGAREGLSSDQVAEVKDNDDVVRVLADRVSAGDVVLVKGSRAMKMEEIVRRLEGPSGAAKGGGANE
ncbi:MAG TPA: UDP-N-acetylmuramoyl-tripeptide--D-alanyl-D-alanine ligase [Armatimonadota bacterium]|nr:UDP-N-acetylmuramoyl-tripeptide--D-alanyl-D-alanine ligase [Armatimonadota bacterium]